MNRRNFLKGIVGLGATTLLPDFVYANGKILKEVKDDVDEIINLENFKKYEKSILSVGKREVEFFISFFDIAKNKDTLVNDFILKVKELQTEFNFSEKSKDGILGTVTLKKVYLDFYSKNIEKLDDERKKRLEIYNEMLLYSKKHGALYGQLDIFKNETYFGKDVGLNIKGTFINENLIGKLPETIDTYYNKIIITKINGKRVLTFYINGKLYLATYISPGLITKKTPRLKTIGKTNPDKYHISSEYPEAEKKKNGIKGGAVLPYAVHVDGSIWIHGSDGRIDGTLQSHGCIRTPLLYMKEIHDKVSKLGIKNVLIDTTGIY